MSKTNELLKKINSRDDIPEFLRNTNLNNTICELGVFSGVGIELLAQASPTILIGIDIWQDNGIMAMTDGMTQSKMNENYESALKIMLKYPFVKYIKGYTRDYVHLFEDGYFDFIFVDSDHSYEGVKNDLNDWWPKVKSGGVLAGHDYFEITTAYKFGVVEAVDEFRQQYQIPNENFHVTPESFAPSYFIVKQ